MKSVQNISKYKTLIYDCDGVILDSNHVKTRAFHTAALPWGEDASIELVNYHISHGGVSRYKKFDYFLRHIIGRVPEENDMKTLLDVYANEVREGLRNCAIAQGIQDLRKYSPETRWLVVSGGDQNELRDIFMMRNIDVLFNGGIFGSPDNKDVILAREIGDNNILMPALFLGDSRYDHEAAKRAGVDFVFVSGWSEFSDWQAYVIENEIPTVHQLSELIQ